MNKEFVPYDLALELKELGFNEPCFGWYSNMEGNVFRQGYCETYLGIENCAKAPTFSQAFRWFREKHDLVHHINRDGGWWLCSILNLYDEEDQGAIETHIDNCYPDTYEESEIACLKELIKIVKNG